MKQDILKIAALSLLTFASFILTSINQTQSSHAQNGTTTTAQSAPTEKTVEQVFKNIKVLNGMPQSQLYPTMRFMAASLGFQCGSCYMLKYGFGDKRERLYFDVENALLRRRISYMSTIVATIPQQTDFEDYREVEGLKLPFMITVSSVDRGS